MPANNAADPTAPKEKSKIKLKTLLLVNNIKNNLTQKVIIKTKRF